MSTDKVFSDAVPFTFYEQLLEKIEIDGEVYRVACLAPMMVQSAEEEMSQQLPLWQLMCAVAEHKYRLFTDEESIREYVPNWNRIPRVIEHLFLYASCLDSDMCVFEGHFSRHENPFVPSLVRSDVTKRICIEADTGIVLLYKY